MIWIIGEYAEKIQNAGELLSAFLDNFGEETSQVQMQLLTAIVKLFLKKPGSGQDLVQQVLQLATTKADNPDLRDRGYVLWRLLSTDPNVAKSVVLADKPPITIDLSDGFTGTLLDVLVDSIGTLASVYHKPAAAFSDQGKIAPTVVDATPRNISEITEDALRGDDDDDGGDINQYNSNSNPGLAGDLLDLDLGDKPTPGYGGGASQYKPSSGGNLLDLLDDGPASASAQSNSLFGGFQDLLGGMPTGAPQAAAGGAAGSPTVVPNEVWLAPQQGGGMEISGTFSRKGGVTTMLLTIVNKSNGPLSDFAVQFNKNSFGINPAAPLTAPGIMPGQKADASLQLNFTGQKAKMTPLNALQVAVKNSAGVFYFQCLVPVHVLFTEDGRVDQTEFMQLWQTVCNFFYFLSFLFVCSFSNFFSSPSSLQTPNEQVVTVSGLSNYSSLDAFKARFSANNIAVIAQRKTNNMDSYLLSAKVLGSFLVMMDLVVHPSLQSVRVTVKSQTVDILPTFQQGLDAFLRA